MKNISILGVSGSIGRQALDVCRWQPRQLRVVAMTAGQDWRYLAKAAREWRPQFIALADEHGYSELKAAVADLPIRTGAGESAILEVASYSGADTTLIAIPGMAGMKPLLAAIAAGKDIALANKETLVAGGELLMPLIRDKGLFLAPVDSEHSALWQCLSGERTDEVERLILTASGGAFRDLSLAQLSEVTPDMALRHPNWRMGPKITVDCATMVNKGLEIMEAHWLFDIPYQRIEVLIHPQSIVHSLVGFSDGSFKAQLSQPDMRLPIQYALMGRERPLNPASRMDLAKLARLDFSKPDPARYPALNIMRKAAVAGGNAPAYMNGANEVLVQSFLAGRLPFYRMAMILTMLMDRLKPQPINTIKSVFDADEQGRTDAVKMMSVLTEPDKRKNKRR